jgi:hypothetical protein
MRKFFYVSAKLQFLKLMIISACCLRKFLSIYDP